MPDEFHGDKTLLTFHETLAFSLLTMSAKIIIFNVIKLSIFIETGLITTQIAFRYKMVRPVGTLKKL